MNTLWLPLQWFIEVFNLVIDFQVIPGLSLGTISLGFLAIVLIFRMIIFPLTGGSISSAITKVSNGSDNKHASRIKSQRISNRSKRGD